MNDTRSRYPEDTDRLLHIYGKMNLIDILVRAQEKWPDIKPEEIETDMSYVQVRCFGHDQYDSSDYACILEITPTEAYFARMAESAKVA